jgi:probable HAF family extracellular repeat protein
MRQSIPHALFMSAALLAGCSADSVQGPRPSTASALFERSPSHAGGTFTFKTIDVPNALATIAYGINARGDIVGTYVDAAHQQHGFRLRDGDYQTIDFRAADGVLAAVTEARGIGPDGEIVGDYTFAGEPAVNAHGYRLTKGGEFVPVSYPGHTNTVAQRILPDGTILGCRHDNNTMGSMDGIVIGRDGNREIGQFASMNNGATPDLRQMTGFYTNMSTGLSEGYLIVDGVFSSFTVPNARTTAAWDMNPSGEIVGVYTDMAKTPHGFLRRGDDDYTSIDVSGASVTRAFGINARGDIVGSYVAGGQTHAFVTSVTRDDDR